MTATNRHPAPRRDADGLTADQLRQVPHERRRHAARFARTEAQVTAFLDRADEIRAEAGMLKEQKNRR